MPRQRIAVVDYGMGNLRSVGKALEHVAGDDADVLVTSNPQLIQSADRVVFPGQGAIRDCMRELDARGLREVVKGVIASRPVLGICMGLQVLFDSSAEHRETAPLGIVPGSVERFPGGMDSNGTRLKIPHMGWNRVARRLDHPLWRGIEDDSRFYFVHSYFVVPDAPGIVAATTAHGVRFCSAVARESLFAVQFHPEKSQRSGLELLANFVAWDGTR